MHPDEPLFPDGAARALPVRGRRAGVPYAHDDWVAEEVPVALEFNGITQAVMLATPADLEDFALGFALSEGLLEDAAELYGIEQRTGPDGITLALDVGSRAAARLQQRRRTLAGRTGCGLCGVDSLAQVERPLPARPLPDVPIDPAAVAGAMRALDGLQVLNRATGTAHAAAWCSLAGEVRLLREDVGRHNALDKLIGALRRGRRAPAGEGATPLPAGEAGFVAVTSRASVEMVQKTLVLGVPLLAAVSAPTTYAVRLAGRAGLTLVGFARGDDLAVYTRADRLGLAPAP